MKKQLLALVALCAVSGWADVDQNVQNDEPVLLPLTNLVWRCGPNARIENGILTVDVPPEKAKHGGTAWADLDLAPYRGHGVKMTVRARGERIAQPPQTWLGLKFQFSWVDEFGQTHWPNTHGRVGDFEEQEIVVTENFKAHTPAKGRFMLGLQKTSGKVVFDLNTLKAGISDGLFRVVNEDWTCRYPPETLRAGQPNLRGVMLPGGPCREDDFKTLREWGATLARYQMTRWFSEKGKNRDLADFDRWLDGKLDHLERDVLPWARKYGIQICIDLHVPPGGRDETNDLAMYYDKTYAAHFVTCWRRIATRFKGQSNIYGYDLINEPVQTRRATVADYWTLQRLAAEEIRKIDPTTPIIIEAVQWDSADAFAYLSPLRLDNIIYQVHMYQPGEYTHQGVHAKTADYGHYPWPNPEKKWDKDYIRSRLAPVRAFEKKHNAKIYVGEFSAINWAEGADRYIADCIDVFNEYNWDWTFHAFREWPGWSVEHVGTNARDLHPSSDNPRKRALLEGLRKGIK